MKILITMLSILYSSYLYADLNLSISYRTLDQINDLNIKNLEKYEPFKLVTPRELEREPGRDICINARCIDPKVVMSTKPIKDYSDVVTKPSYVGTTVEETVEAAVRAEKARLEKEKENEKKEKK
ncbi:MAG: hypothetical protein RR425_06500 [Erysipelotrichales bacterium]